MVMMIKNCIGRSEQKVEEKGNLDQRQEAGKSEIRIYKAYSSVMGRSDNFAVEMQ